MFIYKDRALPTDDTFQVFASSPKDKVCPEDKAELEEVASEFWARFGVVFANELKDGWFEELASVGRFLSGDGKKELKDRKEVMESIGQNGKIQFLPSFRVDLRKIVNTLFQE